MTTIQEFAEAIRNGDDPETVLRVAVAAHTDPETGPVYPADNVEGVCWWIVDGAWLHSGGRKFSGPYNSREDASTARSAVEKLSGRHTYFIDSEPIQATLAEAWDAGWMALVAQERRQQEDPTHPITRENPYR